MTRVFILTVAQRIVIQEGQSLLWVLGLWIQCSYLDLDNCKCIPS